MTERVKPRFPPEGYVGLTGFVTLVLFSWQGLDRTAIWIATAVWLGTILISTMRWIAEPERLHAVAKAAVALTWTSVIVAVVFGEIAPAISRQLRETGTPAVTNHECFAFPTREAVRIAYGGSPDNFLDTLTNYEVDLIERGMQCEVLERDGSFVRIRWKDAQYWVHAENIDRTSQRTVTTDVAPRPRASVPASHSPRASTRIDSPREDEVFVDQTEGQDTAYSAAATSTAQPFDEVPADRRVHLEAPGLGRCITCLEPWPCDGPIKYADRVTELLDQWDAGDLEEDAVMLSNQEANSAAWRYLTDGEPTDRELQLALRLARYAVATPGGRRAEFLDTLALARFETGDVDGAIATARQALELAASGSWELRTELARRLATFEAAAHEE